MGSLREKLERLRRLNAEISGTDTALARESADRGGGNALESLRVRNEDDELALESIVLRRTRPVLTIKENEVQLVFVDEADSQIWKERLQQAAPLLDSAVRAVGRIELQGSHLEWVGTGWLVSDDILVTNRHVANEFAVRKGEGFSFRMGSSGAVRASVDFLQEIDNPNTLMFRLLRPLHIEAAPGPDVAFFKIEIASGDPALARPIVLTKHVVETENAATIGYPAFDSRIPEPDLMERIYGRTYNKKRLAPGGVTRIEATRLLHNCTTLGGNSGSVVLDLNSGEALGLHFSGSFLTTNYAVRADVVRSLLDRLGSGRGSSAPAPRGGVEAAAAACPQGRRSIVTRLNIPLTVTIALDDIPPASVARASLPPAPDDDEEGNEAIAADYRDREGYRTKFLGPEVPLPTVARDAADVLRFQVDGHAETVLKYEHYSVVMSRSRRMCFFSAVNIDGGLSKKTKRVSWKWDPRIPRAQQIMNECYGSPPRFSRGHMTRREDPAWGDDVTARRGNEDSMHVTNVTPQMQAFNSPIWLALEDYALDHAREDDMKISVFTGAYFSPDDPVMYGVPIPTAFWKIIAFIHDETGALCATGYEMDQSASLQPEEEFVFGQFSSPQLGVATQVSIRSIEARSGISFGDLAEADPLNAGEESLAPGGVPRPLESQEHIRFT